MRLISLHADAVRALERLRVPFDDLTPEGLWGSPYHLIGITGDQRGVLEAWNLEVNDITPGVLHAAELSPQLREAWPQPRPRATQEPRAETLAAPETNGRERTREAQIPVPMVEEPKKHGDPLGHTAERELVGRAAAAAEAAANAPPPASKKATEVRTAQKADQAPPKADEAEDSATERLTAPRAAARVSKAERQDPTRLRVSVGGKYREAAVREGKILLDGQQYDSPAQATRSVAPAKGDWVFWEYFDADAGKWRMLDRDWQPGATT